MTAVFPYQIEPIDEQTQQEVREKFLAYGDGLVKVQPLGYVMLNQYSLYAEKYYNFKFRSDDVIIMTYPKCGTTWMQEIVWIMRNGLDVTTSQDINVRSPFLEFDSLESSNLEPYGPWVEGFKSRNPGKDYKTEGLYLDMAVSSPSPRTIKTHLPFSLLNPSVLSTAKVIYVVRNPKDACVSFYHHHRLIKVQEFDGDFSEFVDFWCRDLVTYAPFWSHVAEAWSKRDHQNVLFMFYEDMQRDIMRELRRLNTFLGTSLSEEDLTKVANHTKFTSMKANPATNPTKIAVDIGRFKDGEGEFIRKGITGDWVNYFTPDLEDKFQTWIESSKQHAQMIPVRYQI